MDGEIEVAWFVLAQLFFSCQAILFFVHPSVHLGSSGEVYWWRGRQCGIPGDIQRHSNT